MKNNNEKCLYCITCKSEMLLGDYVFLFGEEPYCSEDCLLSNFDPKLYDFDNLRHRYIDSEILNEHCGDRL